MVDMNWCIWLDSTCPCQATMTAQIDEWIRLWKRTCWKLCYINWHKPCIDKLYISPILCHNGFWDVSPERAPSPTFNFMVPSSLTRNCLWAEHLASLPKLKEYAFHMLAIRSLVPFCQLPHFPTPIFFCMWNGTIWFLVGKTGIGKWE